MKCLNSCITETKENCKFTIQTETNNNITFELDTKINGKFKKIK